MNTTTKKIKFDKNEVNLIVINNGENLQYTFFIDNPDETINDLSEYFSTLIANEEDEINKVNLLVFFGVLRYMFKNRAFMEQFEDFLFDAKKLVFNLRSACCANEKCVDFFSKLESKLYSENKINQAYSIKARRTVQGILNASPIYEKPLSKKAVQVVQGYYSNMRNMKRRK